MMWTRKVSPTASSGLNGVDVEDMRSNQGVSVHQDRTGRPICALCNDSTKKAHTNIIEEQGVSFDGAMRQHTSHPLPRNKKLILRNNRATTRNQSSKNGKQCFSDTLILSEPHLTLPAQIQAHFMPSGTRSEQEYLEELFLH